MNPNKISLDGDTALVPGDGQAYHLIDLDSDLNISEQGRIAGYYSFSDGVLDGSMAYVNRSNVLSRLDIPDIDNPIETDTNTLGSGSGSSWDYEKSGSQFIVGMYDARAVSYTHLTLPTICSV